MCIIFSVWENVNSVWYLNVIMFYIYMCVCCIFCLREDIGEQKMSFKNVFEPLVLLFVFN